MKVECPNCQTKYNLPDDKVGPGGANVRCSLCKHVFHVDEPVADDFPGFGGSGGEPGWPSGDEDAGQSGAFASHLDAEGRREQEGRTDRFDSVPSSEFTSIDFGKPEKKPGGLSTKTVILAAVLGFVVLAGVAATGAYFFEFWPFVKKPAPSAMEGAPPKPTAPKTGEPAAPAAPDYTSSLNFEGYNYYTVENEKIGSLFVIDGKVVNKTPVVVGQVSVEATLLDNQKKPVVSKVVLAGPKASIFELKTLSKEDLESRLKSTQETMLNNGRVKPGEEIPFMIVFPNVPPTVDSYTMSVKNYFEVRDTPAQPEAKK